MTPWIWTKVTVVDRLWCHACRTSEAEIIGIKNYSSVWIFSKFKWKAHLLPHFHLTELSNSGAVGGLQNNKES